jgi:hydroxypyruvate reductase
VVTPYGHACDCRAIEVVEASHPVPDAAGADAAQRLLRRVSTVGSDDLALCLLSGGGSALLALPAAGLRLADKRRLTQSLLRSGAPIHEINVVRKHLSAIKGGRLAQACHPARVVTLAISDVPGDDPSTIASGPTVPDPSTVVEATAVLERYAIEVPTAVSAWLHQAAAETPKPGDARFERDDYRIVATASLGLDAAAQVAAAAGYEPHVLGEIEGEAREVGREQAKLALRARSQLTSTPGPCVLLSGGETTVTVRGDGTGGPNTELLLGLAEALQGEQGIWALAADTDGIDGLGDNAGAVIAPDTLDRAAKLGLDARRSLAANDSYHFFSALGDLLITGPTRTNLNDFRAILVESTRK